MEKEDARNAIIEVLQTGLTGTIKPEFNIKPADIADAIIYKVEFSSSFTENENKDLYLKISDLKLITEDEYDKLYDTCVPCARIEENKLLLNFARGKIEAYEEILAMLKK